MRIFLIFFFIIKFLYKGILFNFDESFLYKLNLKYFDFYKKKIYEICDFYRARKIENENSSIIFEIAGASERINRFIKEMNQITKIEIVRSGPVAISTHKNTEEE